MSYEQWHARSIAVQDNFANILKDKLWEKYVLPQERARLWNDIAFYFLGGPRPAGVESCYTSAEKDLVEELCNQCIACSLKHFEEVYVAFIFTCVWGGTDAVMPVIRVRYDDSEDMRSAYFVDHTGRVFCYWVEYLRLNNWNGCWICVPPNGKYTSENNAIFYDQTKRRKVLERCDQLATVTSKFTFAATVAGIVLTFHPLSALYGVILIFCSTVIGIPAAVYEAGRRIAMIVDRNVYHQTINPLHSGAARNCWLTTIVIILSVGDLCSIMLMAHMAITGYQVSSSATNFCTLLKVLHVIINGLRLLNSLAEVSQNDKIKLWDVIQMTVKILFWIYTLVTLKTASEKIKQVQQEASVTYNGKDPTGIVKIYEILSRKSQQVGKEARFIRVITHIHLPDHFKHSIIKPARQFNVNIEQETLPQTI